MKRMRFHTLFPPKNILNLTFFQEVWRLLCAIIFFTDLKELGVIDGIIPEIIGGAHRYVAKQALSIKECISDTLHALNSLNGEQLVEDRYEKFKKIGQYTEV